LPEDDGAALASLLDAPAALRRLAIGEPIGGCKAHCGEQEDIQSAIRLAADQIARLACACLPGLAPGNGSLLEHFDDASGDHLIDSHGALLSVQRLAGGAAEGAAEKMRAAPEADA